MNDRIKELALLSANEIADSFSPGFFDDRMVKDVAEINKIFAVLIIKECIKELEISKKGDPYTGDVYDCEYNTCIDDQITVLKEHFGVEETRSQKMKEFGFTRRPRGWAKEEE
jgi:hypothetical protein